MRHLIFALAVFTTTATAQAPAADFSGVHAFWRLVDILQVQGEPTADAWNELFATPGYAALEARERRSASIKLAMRAAFAPSNRRLRDSLLAANGWTARVIRHVQSLPPRRAVLDAFADRMRRDDVVSRAAARAQTLLPAGTVDRFGTPSVAFLFFLPDGRGYPGLIVADLANVMSKTDPQQFFAHEATHFYWAHLSLARRAVGDTATTAGARSLESLLTKIAEEAAGDQFDKSTAVDASDETLARISPDTSFRRYLAEYRDEVRRAPDELRRLDALLARVSSDTSRMQAIVDSASRALPLEGRPVGMYMARAIRAQLGDAALAAIAGDGVGFFRAYQHAASRVACGCIPFSPAALRGLDLVRH